MRSHLVVNVYREDAIEAARQAAAWLLRHGIEVSADRETATRLGVNPIAEFDLGEGDIVVSFGGDGTLLRAAHIASPHGPAVLGVHFGRFGFVTQVRPSELGAALSSFVDGTSSIEERMMVRAELIREGKIVATLHSLNESAVQRAVTSRMLSFEVTVNSRHLATYPADGVLIATPTGSTAYSLSAGGPILEPSIEALVVTAIMPHTLSSRPLVLSASSVVEIQVETMGDTVLSCDGLQHLHLLSGDYVRVSRSDRVVRLVCVDDTDFLEKLSQRLSWSQGRYGGGE
ncbi:MAG: NAD(+)/NADH kinase [Fimbriimonadaceae bacterium]|nr:NAD(+)/NADH kinase [Fimbriimonadaceae bacterium]